MIARLFAMLAVPLILMGQPTVAPTPVEAAQAPGANVGEYNVVNHWETGYRFHDVSGNEGKYRGDVNFGNGLRLLHGQLAVHSLDAQGGLFDTLALETSGLGNDPYQFSSFQVEKNNWYRYQLTYRLNQYFNPGLTISNGQHFLDTERRLQDHDLTLLPQGPVRLFAGMSRNAQEGPALTTANFFNHGGDEFPVFADIRRLRRTYRIGAETRWQGLRAHILRGWDRFEETTFRGLTAPSIGNNPDRDALFSLFRQEPYSGSTPFWNGSVRYEPVQWSSFEARYSHADGQRGFVFEEIAAGARAFGEFGRSILVRGEGRRPVSNGSFTANFIPGERLTISSQTGFYNVSMEGENSYQEIFNNGLPIRQVNFQLLDIRTISHSDTLVFDWRQWLALKGGYGYATRRIRSAELEGAASFTERIEGAQENHQHTGMAGFQIRPMPMLVASVDAEVGRSDQPFYPVSDRDFHALAARLRFRTRSLSLQAQARSFVNNNSASLTSFSSRNRSYSASGTWTAGARSLDLGYVKAHTGTVGGIAYFANRQRITGETSLYRSKLHTFWFNFHTPIAHRVSLFAGVTAIRDTGDGRDTARGAGLGSAIPAFQAVQTFPLRYISPQGRLSVTLHRQVQWNFGYQYYSYAERFLDAQDYRAHTGYTSLLWSF